MYSGLILSLSALALTMPAADVIRYTGETFPEELGFTRAGTLDAERRIEDGWLVQVIRRYGEGESNGQFDGYRYPLAEFAGADRFYAEWRLISDGRKSELVGAAPAGASFAGDLGISYHFTIARDRMCFIRHLRWPILYFDLDDGVSHVHRVELLGEHWYAYLIDGKVMDAGRPDGAYPTEDSRMIWWANTYLHESTARWDYLEFGEMLDPGIDCDAVKRLRAECRQGNRKGEVKGKLRTQLPPGTELRVTCNGDRRTAQIGDNGKAKFRYRRQSGDRTVLLLDCPAISQDVACE